MERVVERANPVAAAWALATAALLVVACGQAPVTCDEGSAASSDEGVAAATVVLPEPGDWTDLGPVLDTGPFGAWDALMEGITPSAIVRRDGRFLLYYVGSHDYIADTANVGPAGRALGVATSDDGLTWTKAASNPVIAYSPTDNPEEGAVSAGMVVDAGGRLLAYYGANAAERSSAILVNADVRLATSGDGIDFRDAGRVLRHDDRRAWGGGDELHAVLALRAGSRYFLYYVPNGSREAGRLGYCVGASPTSLDVCGPVRSGSNPVPARGPSSAVPVGDDHWAVFVSNRGTLHAYVVAAACPAAFGPPLAAYDVGSNSVVTLDRERRTWFMYYDRWTHVGVKVAPDGPPDTTPPTAPPTLTVTSPRHDVADLAWSPAADAETGIRSYEVYRDGVRVASSRTPGFRDTTLAERTLYRYEVRAVNLHGVEGPGTSATVRTAGDLEPPGIEAVSAIADGEVVVTFTEPVSRAAAESPSSYSIDGDVRVLRASLARADGRRAVLATSALTPHAQYTLRVSGVADRAAGQNTLASMATFTASASHGLIGYWTGDHLDASAPDVSGAGNHADVHGNPLTVDGRWGRALQLDGDDCLEIPASPRLDEAVSGDFTLAAWVKPERVPPATNNTDGAFTVFSVPTGLDLRFRSDSRFAVTLHTSAGQFEVASPAALPGQWRHVAAVVDSTQRTLALYVGRRPVPGSPLTFTGMRTRELTGSAKFDAYNGRYRIGAANPRLSIESYFFRGTLDELRIYGRALAPAELEALP